MAFVLFCLCVCLFISGRQEKKPALQISDNQNVNMEAGKLTLILRTESKWTTCTAFTCLPSESTLKVQSQELWHFWHRISYKNSVYNRCSNMQMFVNLNSRQCVGWGVPGRALMIPPICILLPLSASFPSFHLCFLAVKAIMGRNVCLGQNPRSIIKVWRLTALNKSLLVLSVHLRLQTFDT